jgi:hypothetical protein
MVSRDFKIAIKLADRPAWKIAAEAKVNSNTLSRIISGSLRVRNGDERVIRVGRVLGLSPADCFDAEGKK